jgi:hypothetical protein
MIFRPARTRDEAEQAFRLLHDAYVDAGFMVPCASRMRVTPFHRMPGTALLVATREDRVRGTVTVIPDGAGGLPMDEAFDLSGLRNGRRLVEISSLVAPTSRLLFPLLKYMYEFCTWRRTDVLAIAVHPERARFFRAVMGFRDLPKSAVVEHYEFANGAPAAGLYLDLAEWQAEGRRRYGDSPSPKTSFHYFAHRQIAGFEFVEPTLL